MVSIKHKIEENFLKLSIGNENITKSENTFESHLYGFQIQELYKIGLNFYKGKWNFYTLKFHHLLQIPVITFQFDQMVV